MISHMTPNAILLPPLPPLSSLSSVSLLASAPGEVPTQEPVAEGRFEVHASPLHRLCAAFALPTLPPTFRCSFVHAQPQMTLAGRGQQAVAPTCRGNGASEEVILETEQCHMKAIQYGWRGHGKGYPQGIGPYKVGLLVIERDAAGRLPFGWKPIDGK